MIASEASIMESPVNVRPYCRVEPTKEIQNICFNWPCGNGTNQTSANDASENRRPIKNKGGNSFSPAFAKVNPIPQTRGTQAASNTSECFKTFSTSNDY